MRHRRNTLAVGLLSLLVIPVPLSYVVEALRSAPVPPGRLGRLHPREPAGGRAASRADAVIIGHWAHGVHLRLHWVRAWGPRALHQLGGWRPCAWTVLG